MFSNIKKKIAGNHARKDIAVLFQAIVDADCIIIGAGAGLSTAAGFVYSGKRFRENFADFEDKYGFHDMYSGGFYPYETPEEFWAFWSRNIYINRYEKGPNPLYQRLLNLVQDKDYFVLTTNVDHQFQLAGFDKERLFYTQGDYGLFQCSEPCHNKTYDNEATIRKMRKAEHNMCIPTELIPHCPVCNKPMSLNLRCDDTFVEDEGWHIAAERYHKFLSEHKKQSVLFLELGTGYNTPGIIKYPFWQMTNEWPHAKFASINLHDAFVPDEISDRSICVAADIDAVLRELTEK